jgi:hypothetical protein
MRFISNTLNETHNGVSGWWLQTFQHPKTMRYLMLVETIKGNTRDSQRRSIIFCPEVSVRPESTVMMIYWPLQVIDQSTCSTRIPTLIKKSCYKGGLPSKRQRLDLCDELSFAVRCVKHFCPLRLDNQEIRFVNEDFHIIFINHQCASDMLV